MTFDGKNHGETPTAGEVEATERAKTPRVDGIDFTRMLERCGTFIERHVIVEINDSATFALMALLEGVLESPCFEGSATGGEVVRFPVGSPNAVVAIHHSLLRQVEHGPGWISLTMGNCIVSITDVAADTAVLR